MEYLRPALEAEADWDTVSPIVQRILSQGNGASRQRQWLQQSGSWQFVVDCLAQETRAGVSPKDYVRS